MCLYDTKSQKYDFCDKTDRECSVKSELTDISAEGLY